MIEISDNEITDWIIKDKNIYIHRSANIYNNTIIMDNCIVGENVVIGRDNIDRLFVNNKDNNSKTIIEQNCIIDANTYISHGAILRKGVKCSFNSFIGRYSEIGCKTKVHHQAQIFENVKIGENCKIGGLCCNDSIIGNSSNVYGTLCHVFKIRDEPNKKAPIIGNNVTIGIGSVIIGGIVIEDDCYIAANAIVTHNVYRGTRVRNVNELF